MRFSRVFAAFSLCTVASLASAGGFDGPAVQVGLDISAAQTQLSQYSPDGKISDQNLVGELALNYSKSYGSFNLAGGVFALLGSQDSGALRSFSEDTGGVWWDEFKLKNIWGVSIQPGVNVSESTLVYAKLSVVRATGENVYDYSGATAGDTSVGSATAKHHGVGLGMGVKFQLSPNLYGVVEVEQLNFKAKQYYVDANETYKPSLVKGMVGIGYRF